MHIFDVFNSIGEFFCNLTHCGYMHASVTGGSIPRHQSTRLYLGLNRAGLYSLII